MTARFDHILIANRGEIAMRIIRTARQLGYRTTAIYSAADSDAPHVRAADHAVMIGPAAASASYLDIDRVLAAAARTGAGAVHPGYGFLSENAAFASACAARGLVFIGPDADVIALMGNKAQAKLRAEQAGVPCVPGYQGGQDEATLTLAAHAIGYPVMIKAAAGGGGRGMRLALESEGFVAALRLARSEARNAFGSEEMILEKAVMRPRHIEVQVLADEHGNVLHLGERDCSVQRRHQKIIEEAPSPAIDDRTRAAMVGVAVELARAIGYRGVGTVEFIVDESGSFYFIEMNTRLQVEHPVTETVTGIDLVAQQIHVAQGWPLMLRQHDITIRGHAIEARLYAEDPSRDFLPSTGRIAAWHPAIGPGVRIDDGIRVDQTVTPHYDPMLAKIIVGGASRAEALVRLERAIAETVLLGPGTNAAFLRACLTSDTFVKGEATTAFIGDEFADGLPGAEPTPKAIAVAAMLVDHAARARALASSLPIAAPLMGWSSDGDQHVTVELACEGFDYAIALRRHELGQCLLHVDGHPDISVALIPDDPRAANVDDVRTPIVADVARDEVLLHIDGTAWRFSLRNLLTVASEDKADGASVRAPMHGAVLEVFVTAGDVVEPGDRLLILEAMKMQHELKAGIAGTVTTVLARAGEQAAINALLIELAPMTD